MSDTLISWSACVSGFTIVVSKAAEPDHRTSPVSTLTARTVALA
jgi:hypothetical protein